MEFDIVEDLNKHFIDEDIDDVDFSNFTTTIVHDQLNTISPQSGMQLTNTKTVLEQISPANQQMDIYEEENLFYDGEVPFSNGNLDMNVEFSNLGHLSGNEESINLSAPANDEYNVDFNNTSFIMHDNYTIDLLNSQASSSSNSYPSVLNSNPMLAANPSLVIPKQMYLPCDDSNQMQASQESLSISWKNLIENESQIKNFDSNNNNNEAQQNEFGGKKRKYGTKSCDTENPENQSLNKLNLLNIPATTSHKPDISTPDIVEEALILGEYYESKSCKNSPSSPAIDVGREEEYVFDSDVKEEETINENPPSVQSCSSDFATSSNISTAPPTPSCSTNGSTTTPQKRRGRPPKSHSYRPNPEELRRLPEPERKYREQRYKNNEASRQSRINRKKKEEKDREELERQEEENNYLTAMYNTYDNVHSQLLQYLFQLIEGDKHSSTIGEN